MHRRKVPLITFVATQIQLRNSSLEVVVVVINSCDLIPAIIVGLQEIWADLRHFLGKGEHKGIWAEGHHCGFVNSLLFHRAEEEI